MIESRFYPIYQGAGWSLLYAVIIGSLYFNPAFTPLEFLFAFVLIMSAAAIRISCRVGFKRWLKPKSLLLQILLILCFQIAAVGAARMARLPSCFVKCLLTFRLGVLDPFDTWAASFRISASDSLVNAFNMLIAAHHVERHSI